MEMFARYAFASACISVICVIVPVVPADIFMMVVGVMLVQVVMSMICRLATSSEDQNDKKHTNQTYEYR